MCIGFKYARVGSDGRCCEHYPESVVFSKLNDCFFIVKRYHSSMTRFKSITSEPMEVNEIS